MGFAMSFDFLNPAMLLGLAGVSLPVLAHLLSKRKFDVVNWGAMQFLELGRNTRRRIRLEEILLMLLRMGLIALLAIALARPWASGGFLSQFAPKQKRDVVLVIDGSYSMGWEGGAETPHATAIQWAHRLLEELQPGDTVSLLDARDQVRPVIESPVQNMGIVREELNQLPGPSGSSNLAEATAKGVQILNRTTNLVRDVIVLTDGQARGWSADDVNLWARFDDQRSQAAVKPRVWMINVHGENSDRTNFSVDRLQLSRELTVANFPIRVKTKVHYSGGTDTASRHVHLEVDGQRMAENSVGVQLQPNGEASVEFEYRFPTEGSHLISVVLENDNLPGDNRADAAVSVTKALPILLIDGDPNLDPTRRETFFAKSALSARENNAPWIDANVVDWEKLTTENLAEQQAVLLANVPRLNKEQTKELKEFVARGGGLWIALGDRIDADWYNAELYEDGDGLLPVKIESLHNEMQGQSQGMRVLDTSMELPWISRFQSEHGGGFAEARFSHWWKIRSASKPPGEEKPDEADESPAEPVTLHSAIAAARLGNNDPLLLTRRYRRGDVALMTSAIDADWSTLPAKPDYVSFLHEVVFRLASGVASRNVEIGVPLVMSVPVDFPFDSYVFLGPDDEQHPAQVSGTETRRLTRLDNTLLPGTYALKPKEGMKGPIETEYFVANFDRGESDLTPLSDADRKLLGDNERLAFIKNATEMQREESVDENPTEFWHLLILAFLGILVGEVFMTRRLVQGGHAVLDDVQLEPEFESDEPHMTLSNE